MVEHSPKILQERKKHHHNNNKIGAEHGRKRRRFDPDCGVISMAVVYEPYT